MGNRYDAFIQRLKKIVNFSSEVDKIGASERIQSAIPFYGANVWILGCSIIIASVGLNINSTAVIIGAMLISPLMGPIIGVGYSVGTGNAKLLRFSALNLLVMVGASLVFSTLFYLLSPLSLANPTELEARTSPTIYDVLIALFGGFAGILENCRKERGTVLSGVAIATALMPPLCTAGYGIAHLDWHFFSGAMFLFIINTVFIVTATYLMVKYLRFDSVGELSRLSSKKGRRIASSVFAIILIPSLIAAFQMVRDNNFEVKVNQFVSSHSVIGDSYVYDTKIGPKRSATISVAGEPLSDEDLASFWDDAAKAGLKREQINLRQNTRTMSKDQMMLLIHDLHGETDLALEKKDMQINALTFRIDSLCKRLDSLDRLQDLVSDIVLQLAEDEAASSQLETAQE